MGVSEAVSDRKVMDHAVADLSKIAGEARGHQVKKAIAGFKIRDGTCLSAAWDAGGVQMYEFLSRFVHRAAARPRLPRHLGPRLRRPRQLQRRRQGTDHLPEIDYDKIDALRGLNISITTTAKERRRVQGACSPLH